MKRATATAPEPQRFEIVLCAECGDRPGTLAVQRKSFAGKVRSVRICGGCSEGKDFEVKHEAIGLVLEHFDQVERAGPAFRERAVIVRIDGRPSRVALLVGAPAPGFYVVRLALGGNGRYRPRKRRILADELVRDASPRETTLGYVIPGVTQ